MSSSNESELIASLEEMEVKEDNADSFNEGDLVFAKSIGYIAWPGVIVEKQSSHSIVNFLGSDETRRIDNAKIWTYNESTKAQYVTSQNLEYGEFRDAILIAEKLNCVEVNKENGDYYYRVLNQSDLEEQNEQEKESPEEARQGEGSSIQEKSKTPGKEEPDKEEHAEEEHAEEQHAEEQHAEEQHAEEQYVEEENAEEQQAEEKYVEEQYAEEEHAEEENAEEENAEEDPGKEELDQKDSGRETPGENDDDTITYLRMLRSSRDSLNGNLEKKFIDMVNFLRQSLKINHKDYPSALLTLQELHEMPLSELLLVRNFEAVNSIYLICFLDTAHRNYDEAIQVKLLARQLITRIALMYNMPGGSFIDHLRSLSVIYRRYTKEIEPPQRESSKEEYCHEFVAEEEEILESLAGEEGGQDSVAVEEGAQESWAVKEDGQESLAVKEDGQESLAVKEDGQEGLALENDGLENGHDALAVEEGDEEPLFSFDHIFPTSEIDERFDQLINILRSSLTFRQKDYPSALLAFDELLSFTFTKDFLLPKYKAVYFIYYLARSGCVFPWNDLAKATLVRNLANQLMVRFFSVFNFPGITAYDFMVHFCSLYPENIPCEWESD